MYMDSFAAISKDAKRILQLLHDHFSLPWVSWSFEYFKMYLAKRPTYVQKKSEPDVKLFTRTRYKLTCAVRQLEEGT